MYGHDKLREGIKLFIWRQYASVVIFYTLPPPLSPCGGGGGPISISADSSLGPLPTIVPTRVESRQGIFF